MLSCELCEILQNSLRTRVNGCCSDLGKCFRYLKTLAIIIAFAEYLWIFGIWSNLKHDIVFKAWYCLGKMFSWKTYLVALKKWVLSKFFSTKLLLVKIFDPYFRLVWQFPEKFWLPQTKIWWWVFWKGHWRDDRSSTSTYFPARRRGINIIHQKLLILIAEGDL